jgi:hypothetical protein
VFLGLDSPQPKLGRRLPRRAAVKRICALTAEDLEAERKLKEREERAAGQSKVKASKAKTAA